MGMISSPGVHTFPSSTDPPPRYSQTPPVPARATGGVTYTKIRVHFDKFTAKWDEWYDTNSHKLAPIGCYTSDPAAIPPIPIFDKFAPERTAGTTAAVLSDSNRRQRPQTPQAATRPLTKTANSNPNATTFSFIPTKIFKPFLSSGVRFAFTNGVAYYLASS